MKERKKAVLLNQPFSVPIIADHGVLFYIYSNSICERNNTYTESLSEYASQFHSFSPSVFPYYHHIIIRHL